MREKRLWLVITFHTTAAAMAVEKLCAEQGIPGRLIPVPREISAGCGMAWRMPPAERENFLAALAGAGIEAGQCYELLL